MLRKRNRKRKLRKRYQGRNRHHLLPRSRGGSSSPDNLLLIKIERHNAWHEIFGLRNLDEVISLLQRVKHWKQRQAA